MSTPDFNKVWGSNSSLTPYEFSDSEYLKGWESVGATPPTRTQFDALQRNNDLKAQYLKDGLDEVKAAVQDDTREPSTEYAVGTIIANKDLPATFYLKCKVGGTSSDTSFVVPSDIEEGDTITDGTIVWEAIKLVSSDELQTRKWKEGKFETLVADDIIAKGPIVDVRAFGAVGDGVTDDTSAFESAISAAENNTLFIPNGNYKINSTLIANKAKSVVNNGDYTGIEPIYPIGDNLSKMALNLTPEIQINYPSAAEPTSTVSYYCQSVGYCPDTDHVLLVFAGYTIATGANDQPGKVVEMTADYQTVINSATVDVGHGNGCCYCSKDQKWYIATGTGIISLNSDLSLNSTHLTGSYWTIEYNANKDFRRRQRIRSPSTPPRHLY